MKTLPFFFFFFFSIALFALTIALPSHLQRGGAYAVLLAGWSLGAYLIQWTLGNLKDLFLNHNQWVIGYLVVVGEFNGRSLSS